MEYKATASKGNDGQVWHLRVNKRKGTMAYGDDESSNFQALEILETDEF